MTDRVFLQTVTHLRNAILNRESIYVFQSTYSSDNLLKQVYETDPRLVGQIENINISKRKFPLSDEIEYVFKFIYSDSAPTNINSVKIDHVDWDIKAELSAGSVIPPSMFVVTKTPDTFIKQTFADNIIREFYPGIISTSYSTIQCASSEYSLVKITPMLCMDEASYVKLQSDTRNRVNMIINESLGGFTDRISKPIKVFLAFSYLQQNVSYYYEAAKIQDITKVDPAFYMPYGPILERRGGCEGIANAFKVFMDTYGIPCRIVCGLLNTSDVSGPHAWNMVQIGSFWYHVDATVNIMENRQIYIGCFLAADKKMKKHYIWDMEKYPSCNSSLWNYERIAGLIEEQKVQLSAIEERYLDPEIISCEMN